MPRISLPILMQRLRGALSSARQRKSRSGVESSGVFAPLFASSGSFSFAPIAVDVTDLEIAFRLRQWSGFGVAGRCTAVVMEYAMPSFDNPSRSIEIRQRDLVNSKTIPDFQATDEGRLEAELMDHQRLYRLHARELWFNHASKRTLTLEALPNRPTIMDTWYGTQREYQVFRTFNGTVVSHVIFGGFAEHEALELLQHRLTSVASNGRLAMWHDEQHRMHASGPFHSGTTSRTVARPGTGTRREHL